jgi:Diadenosine tetraphosphate (Ap4A) hydrolase and other HIT family hydrolases
MPATCAFCAIIRDETPAVTICETERLIAFLDHRPLFHGHTLLVPKQHVRLLSELPAEQVPEFFTTAQRLERAVEDGLGADGSMILINNVVSQSSAPSPARDSPEQGRWPAVLARAAAPVRRSSPGGRLRGEDQGRPAQLNGPR